MIVFEHNDLDFRRPCNAMQGRAYRSLSGPPAPSRVATNAEQHGICEGNLSDVPIDQIWQEIKRLYVKPLHDFGVALIIQSNAVWADLDSHSLLPPCSCSCPLAA